MTIPSPARQLRDPLHLLLLALLLGGGCIGTGAITLPSGKTALEQQAAGSFPELEDGLTSAGVSPRPVPLTRGQIDKSGAPTEPLALTEDAPEDSHSDVDRVDRLLVRGCIGEALDGTLQATPATCQGAVDQTLVLRLLERQNRDRWQVWRYLQAQRPKESLDQIRAVWRKRHLQTVLTGAPVQAEDKSWSPHK